MYYVIFFFSLVIVSSSQAFLVKRSRKSSAGFQLNILKYGGLQHAGVLVTNTEKSKKWYMEVFGFLDDSHLRPDTLPYPGAFLKCGSDQIHLMELPSMDPKEGRPAHGGRDRHVAITMNNLDKLNQLWLKIVRQQNNCVMH